ncbi:MAG: hypothetical protein AAGI24_08190 [Pseudomonadota bacterium]
MSRLRIFVFMLLAGMGAVAQTGNPEASNTSPTEQQPATRSQTAEENEPAADDGADTADNPFDYEASEQISEDLSVSFPVDI